jgi:hypothetical protein
MDIVAYHHGNSDKRYYKKERVKRLIEKFLSPGISDNIKQIKNRQQTDANVFHLQIKLNVIARSCSQFESVEQRPASCTGQQQINITAHALFSTHKNIGHQTKRDKRRSNIGDRKWIVNHCRNRKNGKPKVQI